MLYKKNRKISRLKRIIIAVIAFFIILVVLCEIQLSDFTPNYIRMQAENMSVNAISDAVNETLEKLNYSYAELASVNYSDNGKVSSITTDSIKINKINADVAKAVNEKITKLYASEVQLPLGAFTDITVLSNVGPLITVSFSLTGSVSSQIISTFESSGINQTIHHIKLLITSKIMTTSLDYSGEMTFTTDFEVAQSIIVGEIPSAYGTLYRTN